MKFSDCKIKCANYRYEGWLDLDDYAGSLQINATLIAAPDTGDDEEILKYSFDPVGTLVKRSSKSQKVSFSTCFFFNPIFMLSYFVYCIILLNILFTVRLLNKKIIR